MNDPKLPLEAPGDRPNDLPVWAIVLMLPVLIPIGIVGGILAWGVIFAFIPCFMAWGCWEHWRYHRKLRKAGRVACWADIEGPLNAGRGTLIVVQSVTGPLDSAWWVPDAMPSLPTHPLPTYRQWAALDFPANFDLLESAGPAAKEYRDRYTDADRGTAARVELPRGVLSEFLDEIPEASVVIILSC